MYTYQLIKIKFLEEYEVTVLTTNINYAGTGDPIYYTFIGSNGSTSEHLVHEDLYAGYPATHRFNDTAKIGKFECLDIRRDGTDGWHFQEV